MENKGTNVENSTTAKTDANTVLVEVKVGLALLYDKRNKTTDTSEWQQLNERIRLIEGRKEVYHKQNSFVQL